MNNSRDISLGSQTLEVGKEVSVMAYTYGKHILSDNLMYKELFSITCSYMPDIFPSLWQRSQPGREVHLHAPQMSRDMILDLDQHHLTYCPRFAA